MKINTKLSLLALLLFSNLLTFAQPGNDQGGGGLEGNDPPPASIDTLVIVMAIIGTLFVFNIFKKQSKRA